MFLKNCIPFAVIGSNTIIESGGTRIRGRIYPWGIIDIESDSCDFKKLRTFLCRFDLFHAQKKHIKCLLFKNMSYFFLFV